MRKQIQTETPQQEAHEFEIDEELTLYSYEMDPLVLYPIAPRIVKILAPILENLSSLGDLTPEGIERMLKSDVGRLAPLLDHLAGALAKQENANLPLELFQKTAAEVEGEDGEPTRLWLSDKKNINKVFRGKFFGMLRAMVHAVMVNFSDFSFGGSSTGRPTKE